MAAGMGRALCMVSLPGAKRDAALVSVGVWDPDSEDALGASCQSTSCCLKGGHGLCDCAMTSEKGFELGGS